MGLNSLKATEPLQGNSLLLPLSSQEFLWSFNQPLKGESLSQLWSHSGFELGTPGLGI